MPTSSWWRYFAVLAATGAVLGSVDRTAADEQSNGSLAVVRNVETGRVYYLRKILAEGAYGVVYACEDAFGQPLVMKVLKHGDSLALHNQWMKEASLLSSLVHPNIIALYDAFYANGFYHFVLERADGNLRELVQRRGPFNDKDVLHLAAQLLSALHHVHSRRLIHRDLHMDNILYVMRGDGYPQLKLADFGISVSLPPGERRAYDHLGKPFEYAPELVQYGHTTTKSDLYQLGLVLYFLRTGQSAVSASDGDEVTVILSGLAQQRAMALNSPLGQVLIQLLSPSPSRIQTCEQVWERVKEAAQYAK